MRDAFLELLLRIRRQQPEEWAALGPEMKLAALEYEARQRERQVLDEDEETEAA